MKEFPDDELDKLFRKSSEELDSTFDPDDWNALKRKLDEHDGKTPGAFLKKWWPVGLLALLFVAGLTTYVLTSNGDDRKQNLSRISVEKQLSGKTQKADPGKAIGKELENGSPEAALRVNPEKERKLADSPAGTEDINPAKRDLLSVRSSKNVLADGSKNRKILPRRWSKTGGVYLEPDRSIGRKVDGAFYSDNKNSKTGRRTKADSFQKQDLTLEENKLNTLSFSENDKKPKEEISRITPVRLSGSPDLTERAGDLNPDVAKDRLVIRAYLLKSKSFVLGRSEKLPEVEKVEAPVTEEPSLKAKEQVPMPKLAVRFGFSPDLSSVGLKNFTKPGTAVSLLVEYSFLPKLYFQTGLISSSKGYNARPGEYEWPSSWNDQKARPTSVDALCKVIELPLNFRYDVSQSDRSRWFVGAGASSYYMKNEKYIYNYAPHTYNVIWYEHEAATGWYWLSHLNASAGYEYRFSKKLSLLAEPYVRIPIKKVGYGKVNLFSTGVWFSIRYTPVFK